MIKLLLVDDEPMIRKGLAKLIEKTSPFPVSICFAEDGADALKQVEREKPDLVFTDIRMPRMDGLDLCGVIHDQYRHIQLVVISGYDDFDYARKCISYGVKEFLLKPVTRDAMQKVLQLIANQFEKREHMVSVVKLENWIDAMEEAIWTLDNDRFKQLMDEWIRDTQSLDLVLHQKIRLVEEVCSLIGKRLTDKNTDVLSIPDDWNDMGSDEQVIAELADRITAVMEHLRQKRKGNYKDPITEAKQYIERHLSKEVSLEEVAEFIGLNASYFSQLFKQSTGETFVKYRIKQRMERAKQLLAEPHQRITDISYEIGYADHPHFTKTFKKVTGLTPSEYREKLGIDS